MGLLDKFLTPAIKVAGTLIGNRPAINFIGASAVDNATTGAIDITVGAGGVAVSGTPAAGKVPLATSSSAAVWTSAFVPFAVATIQNNGAASVLSQAPSTLATITVSRVGLGHVQITLPTTTPITAMVHVTCNVADGKSASVTQTGDHVWDVYTSDPLLSSRSDCNFFVMFYPTT